MTISDISITKKGRYALFCDGEFAFSIDEETFVEYGIYKGIEIDEYQLNELRMKSEMTKAKAKAFELLSYRAHTKKELLDKMLQRYDEYTALYIVDELEKMGYIDEEGYIKECISYMLNSKKASIRQIKQYLYVRGISKETIDEALVEYTYTEKENIKEIILTKYMLKLSEPNGYRKVFEAMIRRGFNSGDIRSILEEISN